jgi:hypothetical protein
VYDPIRKLLSSPMETAGLSNGVKGFLADKKKGKGLRGSCLFLYKHVLFLPHGLCVIISQA